MRGPGNEAQPFHSEQIISILKEHEAATPVSELCRKHGISDASIYKWKAKSGGMEVSEAKRLKHSRLGWLTPAEFAQTVDPRRDAVLRSRNGFAPQPAATASNTATQNRWSELKIG